MTDVKKVIRWRPNSCFFKAKNDIQTLDLYPQKIEFAIRFLRRAQSRFSNVDETGSARVEFNG
jgi:hypothetical protein